MPNGDTRGEYALDEASRGFQSLERNLGRRGTRTTRSREDANAIRALAEAWVRTYQPAFANVLGAFPAIETTDRAVRDLLTRVGTRMEVADIRGRLRSIARTIDREIIPAYDAARWSTAAVRAPSTALAPLVERLSRVSPDLAASYVQVQADLNDPARATFVGPAGEIREVMRAAIQLLAPDEEVRSQEWFVGHEGRTTQAERIRYIVEQRSEDETSPIDAADIVDAKVGQFGRRLYSRASAALHVGAQREELSRIVGYVDAILNEVLPA
jgi:hypothetical protein